MLTTAELGRAQSAHLDEQLPLWVVALGDGVKQVRRRVAVVAAAHRHRLILQQILHACPRCHNLSTISLACITHRRHCNSHVLIYPNTASIFHTYLNPMLSSGSVGSGQTIASQLIVKQPARMAHRSWAASGT